MRPVAPEHVLSPSEGTQHPLDGQMYAQGFVVDGFVPSSSLDVADGMGHPASDGEHGPVDVDLDGRQAFLDARNDERCDRQNYAHGVPPSLFLAAERWRAFYRYHGRDFAHCNISQVETAPPHLGRLTDLRPHECAIPRWRVREQPCGRLQGQEPAIVSSLGASLVAGGGSAHDPSARRDPDAGFRGQESAGFHSPLRPREFCHLGPCRQAGKNAGSGIGRPRGRRIVAAKESEAGTYSQLPHKAVAAPDGLRESRCYALSRLRCTPAGPAPRHIEFQHDGGSTSPAVPRGPCRSLLPGRGQLLSSGSDAGVASTLRGEAGTPRTRVRLCRFDPGLIPGTFCRQTRRPRHTYHPCSRSADAFPCVVVHASASSFAALRVQPPSMSRCASRKPSSAPVVFDEPNMRLNDFRWLKKEGREL